MINTVQKQDMFWASDLKHHIRIAVGEQLAVVLTHAGQIQPWERESLISCDSEMVDTSMSLWNQPSCIVGDLKCISRRQLDS